MLLSEMFMHLILMDRDKAKFLTVSLFYARSPGRRQVEPACLKVKSVLFIL